MQTADNCAEIAQSGSYDSQTQTLVLPRVETLANGAVTEIYAPVTMALAQDCGAEAFRVTGAEPASN